jgi:hypothetical protein
MMTFLTIVSYILVGIVVCFIIIGLLLCLQFILCFHNRKCKHCNRSMEFKGLRENDDEEYFLFHCNHCGAWEQVTKEEFFRSTN